MSFEEINYIDVDFDRNEFTILKNGEYYTYDIDREITLLINIIDSGNVEYEVYGQERRL